jgi:predicted adenine nucleotide alpha hydrolase (AANH) superfamily ATPase
MKIVLHICCGVCAAGVVERLTSERHQILGLFYNPNIHPLEEYQKRLDVVRRVARELNFPLEATPYTPEEWLQDASPLADEPEGGKRCQVCFRLRLKQTYLYMKTQGCDAFATTLTISPHKSADVINRIGREVGGERFLARDFKKQAGFQQAIELAKKWALYRQNYCGCIYSQGETRSKS